MQPYLFINIQYIRVLHSAPVPGLTTTLAPASLLTISLSCKSNPDPASASVSNFHAVEVRENNEDPGPDIYFPNSDMATAPVIEKYLATAPTSNLRPVKAPVSDTGPAPVSIMASNADSDSATGPSSDSGPPTSSVSHSGLAPAPLPASDPRSVTGHISEPGLTPCVCLRFRPCYCSNLKSRPCYCHVSDSHPATAPISHPFLSQI